MNLPLTKGLLKNSKQQYKEFTETKNSLAANQNWRQTKNFINRRDRLMKNGWRHGVVGVENPKNPDSDVYNDIYNKMMLIEQNKEYINNKRKSILQKVC